MRPKSLILLVLALGCGLIASIGINQVLAKRDGGTGTAAEMVKIYVAMGGIGVREPLTAENVRLEEWPKGRIPAGALTKAEDIESRTTRTRIFAGEPILESKLYEDGETVFGVSDYIPPGYRVVAIKVNDVSGGAKLLLPGDHVDVQVFVRRNPVMGVHQTLTTTVLQNVKVFAVNDIVDPNQSGDPESSISAKTISLVVLPDQAKRLLLANELGVIRLTLRSPDDEEEEIDIAVTIEDILSGPKSSGSPQPTDDSKLVNLLASQSQIQNTVEPAPANGHEMLVIEGGDSVRVFRFIAGQLMPEETAGQLLPGTPGPAATNDQLPGAPLDETDNDSTDLELELDGDEA